MTIATTRGLLAAWSSFAPRAGARLDVQQRRVLAAQIVATLREIGFACELIGASAEWNAPHRR